MSNIEYNQELENSHTDKNSDSFIEINEVVYDYKSPNHKPPFNTDYCEMDIAYLDDEVIRLTVGKNGYNFSKITESNKIAWIYHNKETNKIEIWGKESKFNKVKNEINNYIEWSKRYIQNRDKL